jgi:hypothetical protein
MKIFDSCIVQIGNQFEAVYLRYCGITGHYSFRRIAIKSTKEEAEISARWYANARGKNYLGFKSREELENEKTKIQTHGYTAET